LEYELHSSSSGKGPMMDFCGNENEKPGSVTDAKTSSPAERLLTSQEGLCSVMLLVYISCVLHATPILSALI
jgi:hypothetical protein